MDPELERNLFAALDFALEAVRAEGEAVRREARDLLTRYVHRVGVSDWTFVTPRWNGPPRYTGFNLSQLVLLAGVVCESPPPVALWQEFRRWTEEDLFAEVRPDTPNDSAALRRDVARELDEVVAEARFGEASVHCLELAYQNSFRRLGHRPPHPLPEPWLSRCALVAPSRLVQGEDFCPSPEDLNGFIRCESRRLRVLQGILLDYGQADVTLHRNAVRLQTLLFVFLRYRGSPASVPRLTPAANILAQMLNQVGYTNSRRQPITVALLDQILSRTRRQTRQVVQAAFQRGELPAPAGFRWEALPDPDQYVWGYLFRHVR